MKRVPRSTDDLIVDMEKMNEAMLLAAQDARRLHKQTGHPLVVWHDGKVKWIPADELEIPEDPTESGAKPPADTT